MRRGAIAVRLEGGIGDHILGMRLLYFIRRRYPAHKIIVYSDAGGGLPQLEIARMSPFLSEAMPVYHKKRFPRITTWGKLENIEKRYLDMMRSSDIFFDTWEGTFFIPQSKILNASFHEILARRPELFVPAGHRIRALKMLSQYKDCVFVGLDVSKHGFDFLRKNKKAVVKFIRGLLKDPKVIVLNFYTSSYKFNHWPRVLGIFREEASCRESLKIGALWNIDKRVIPIVDLPVSTVAGLLERCRYFIGVDNGIKHLAWALNIPHTFFIDRIPNSHFTLRWMPDFHRALLFDCDKKDLSRHITEALRCV